MMPEFEFKEKDYVPVTRLTAKVPKVSLEIIYKHLRKNGYEVDFTNPECPDRLIVIWSEKRLKVMIRRGRIEAIVPLSWKERIKEDFRKFVIEDLEWPKFKKEMGWE